LWLNQDSEMKSKRNSWNFFSILFNKAYQIPSPRVHLCRVYIQGVMSMQSQSGRPWVFRLDQVTSSFRGQSQDLWLCVQLLPVYQTHYVPRVMWTWSAAMSFGISQLDLTVSANSWRLQV
jgi:hypothetical protein